MSVEFAALRTVPAFRRALALALAFSGFLAISYLGVKDLELTPLSDARSAVASGSVAGLVALLYAAASSGGEVARGGLATALVANADRRRAVRVRLGAHAAAGACLGLGGVLMAGVLTFVLLGFGGGTLPGAGDVAARVAGALVYGALMGALGAALGIAARAAAPPVIGAMIVLLFLDPLFAGLSDPVARWGFGGAGAALTGGGSGELPAAWAGGLAMLAYTALLGALALVLTVRRDVP